MNIGTIAVIGAGELGRAIAFFALRGGYRVVLEDVSETSLQRAIAAIRENVAEDVSAARINRGLSEQTLLRLTTSRRVEDAAREADFIIETVADELELKLELFTIFDKFAKPGAILASTTQSLSIDDFADMTFCVERCVGMRFARGMHNERRVELVRGRETSTQTVETCREVARRMGVDIIESRDARTLLAGHG